MKVVFDGKVVDEKAFRLDFYDRGFLYGDGLFETMIAHEGHVQHLKRHLARLEEGLCVLGIDTRLLPGANLVQAYASQLINGNAIEGPARLKLIAWRQQGGLYAPTSAGMHFLLTAVPHMPKAYPPNMACGVAQTVQLHASAVSAYKTISAMPYLLAGKEMNNRQLHEIVLTDYRGYVAEALYTNIFWQAHNGQLYTPALSCGCIAGIMRSVIIDHVAANGGQVHEVEAPLSELFAAQTVITCNATGVRYLPAIDGHQFSTAPLAAINSAINH